MSTQDEVQQGADMTEEEIEEKILHVLNIYPVISPTMLQGGIGAYLKPIKWRPVLVRLIDEGKVVEASQSLRTPSGRYNNYTKLFKPENAQIAQAAPEVAEAKD